MLSIFLSVLKIIGFVLLGIIGFVLLILCLVLFVPIRYRLHIDKDKDEGFEFRVFGVVSYLLHLLNVHIEYPSDRLFYVRISLFRIFPRKEKKIKNNKNKISVSEDVEEKFDNDFFEEEISNDIVTAYPIKEDTNEFCSEESDTEESANKESIKDFLVHMVDFLRNFKEKISNICKKICEIKDNADYYLGIINSNTFNHAFNKCKKEFIKLIKIILPASVKGYVEFGGKEPSLTAQVYGFYNVFKPRAFRRFKFIPFLEEERFNGHVDIKGHFCIISILVIAIKVYFNRDIKKTLKMFKKER